MRVPQNIPLCKVIKTRYEFNSLNPTFIYTDDYVPLHLEIVNILAGNETGSNALLTIDFVSLLAHKSYGNYEPPKSYIIPKGYKAVNRRIDGALATSEKDIVSDGLGFVYIYKVDVYKPSGAQPWCRVYALDIVKN